MYYEKATFVVLHRRSFYECLGQQLRKPIPQGVFRNSRTSSQSEIRGQIVNSQSQPMAGVTITNLRTKLSAQSDENGNFLIAGRAGDNLLVQFLGYADQTIVASSGTMHINLETTDEAIDEVVVVGYGTQKASTVTGSIVDVKGDVLSRAPVVNPPIPLAGRLPGLVAVSRSGEPGSDNATLRIRGANTLGNNDPLIVVDGIANRSLERINPQEIESVTV